jgi:hypothetical protein
MRQVVFEECSRISVMHDQVLTEPTSFELVDVEPLGNGNCKEVIHTTTCTIQRAPTVWVGDLPEPRESTDLFNPRQEVE